MKTLYVTVYQQFFDQIARGVKKTEYRQMSEYWVKRLVDVSQYNGMDLQSIRIGLLNGKIEPHWNDYTHIRFKCGKNYLLCEIKGINVYRGHDIFCIKLGKIIKDINNVEQS